MAAAELRGDLEKADIPADISGRAKHFYSIYDKMAKKGREFNEIFDLTAMRVIVDSVDTCYRALHIFGIRQATLVGAEIVRMPETGHFFHRRLMDLRGAIKSGVRRPLPPLR